MLSRLNAVLASGLFLGLAACGGTIPGPEDDVPVDAQESALQATYEVEVVLDQLSAANHYDGLNLFFWPDFEAEIYGSFAAGVLGGETRVLNLGNWGVGAIAVDGYKTFDFQSLSLCESSTYRWCESPRGTMRNRVKLQVRPGQQIRLGVHVQDDDYDLADDEICRGQVVSPALSQADLDSGKGFALYFSQQGSEGKCAVSAHFQALRKL
jgi:hypothetical protein